ncbi:hypothetical protein [Bordetella genomosp. 10]|uniref:hypothetical protein n=1 Tax=Bordetella genomosp. 10 TaxID=1416804 RepID=UPI0015C60471|nr:hypothetical protein [Bordetella genomosp. 10]
MTAMGGMFAVFASSAARRLASLESALDLDRGGGEVLEEAERFPPRMCATETWTPNVQKVYARLGPRGV